MCTLLFLYLFAMCLILTWTLESPRPFFLTSPPPFRGHSWGHEQRPAGQPPACPASFRSYLLCRGPWCGCECRSPQVTDKGPWKGLLCTIKNRLAPVSAAAIKNSLSWCLFPFRRRKVSFLFVSSVVSRRSASLSHCQCGGSKMTSSYVQSLLCCVILVINQGVIIVACGHFCTYGFH